MSQKQLLTFEMVSAKYSPLKSLLSQPVLACPEELMEREESPVAMESQSV